MTMNPVCPHEEAVMAVIVAEGWPTDAAQELRAHASVCAACTDVIRVGRMLREDLEVRAAGLRLPAAGQVWWRAAIRARLEAVQSASQPITWLQGVAAAGIAAVACAAVVFAWPTIWALGVSVVGRLSPGDEPLTAMAPMLGFFEQGFPYIVAGTACVLLAPLVALYMALSERD